MISVPNVEFQDDVGNKFSETAILDLGNVDYPNESAPVKIKIVNNSTNAELSKCLLDITTNKYAGSGTLSEAKYSFKFCATETGTYTSKLWIWHLGASETVDVYLKFVPQSNVAQTMLFNIRLSGMYRTFA